MVYNCSSYFCYVAKSVHETFTRTAQLVQIDGQILSRQFHLADLREHSLLPVTGEHGSDTVNHDFAAKLQPDSVCGAEIDDADSSASVHEEIERLLGLWDVDFDPQEALTKLEGKFRK